MATGRVFVVPSGNPLAPSKKRKRDQADLDEETEHAGKPSGGAANSLVAGISAFTSLTAERAREFRTAGFNPEDELPSYPFPHKAISSRGYRGAPKSIEKELAALQPPIYPHGIYQQSGQGEQDDGRQSQRQRHLAHLTTILHLSLQRAQYQRAGMAWGLLLKAGSKNVELKKTTMNLRRHGNWTIGAEILLRQQGPHRDHTQPEDDDEAGDEDRSNASLESVVSPNALHTTREYYERLAVQYPFHYNRLENPIDFYLATLSLWIYEVTERAKAEKARTTHDLETAPDPDDPEDEDATMADESNSPSTRRARAERSFHMQQETIRQSELRSARDIANRLDEILISPPYDKSPDLLHLRGMISLWLADLFIPDPWPPTVDLSERRQREEDRQHEIGKAKAFMLRCMGNGGRVWDGFEPPVGNASIVSGSGNGTSGQSPRRSIDSELREELTDSD